MKTPTPAMARLLHASVRWAWVSLIPILAGACKPRDMVCEEGVYYQVLQPEEGAGAAPFSIERLGVKLKNSDLENVPGILVLKRNNRVSVSWESGDFFVSSDLIFSPSEGVARNVRDPDNVYPMKRFPDDASERVRFGFRSSSCRSPRKFGICDSRDDNLFLAVEMTCHPEKESRFSR